MLDAPRDDWHVFRSVALPGDPDERMFLTAELLVGYATDATTSDGQGLVTLLFAEQGQPERMYMLREDHLAALLADAKREALEEDEG